MSEVWMHKETGELVITDETFSGGSYVLEFRAGFCDIYPESIKDQFEVIGEW